MAVRALPLSLSGLTRLNFETESQERLSQKSQPFHCLKIRLSLNHVIPSGTHSLLLQKATSPSSDPSPFHDLNPLHPLNPFHSQHLFSQDSVEHRRAQREGWALCKRISHRLLEKLRVQRVQHNDTALVRSAMWYRSEKKKL